MELRRRVTDDLPVKQKPSWGHHSARAQRFAGPQKRLVALALQIPSRHPIGEALPQLVRESHDPAAQLHPTGNPDRSRRSPLSPLRSSLPRSQVPLAAVEAAIDLGWSREFGSPTRSIHRLSLDLEPALARRLAHPDLVGLLLLGANGLLHALIFSRRCRQACTAENL